MIFSDHFETAPSFCYGIIVRFPDIPPGRMDRPGRSGGAPGACPRRSGI